MQLPLFDSNELVCSFDDLHTSKRGKHEHTGVHSWHSYYAGYSEQFVADVFSLLAEPGDLILDPWNGSGTTTLVAQRCGFASIGIEINPIMVLHAQAKSLGFASMVEEIIFKARRIISIAHQFMHKGLTSSSSINDWVHGEALVALIALRDAIEEEMEDCLFPSFVRSVLDDEVKTKFYPSKKKAFFFSALFQVLRRVGKFKRGSNPTWLVLDDEAVSVSSERVFTLFNQIVQLMLQDLDVAAQGAEEIADYWVKLGDSRALSLLDASADLIVTSPPYCTRIDYAFATKPELLLLGYENKKFDTIRRATMGAPVIVDKSIIQREAWGQLCNDFLDAVAEHSSKASQSYYLPTYLQYFQDAELSLREIKRVLKGGRQAVIVVQSSYYKDVELPLGDIYVQMAQQLGFEAEIARREVVRQHMAHVNTKSRRYVKDKVYYEDVVLLCT